LASSSLLTFANQTMAMGILELCTETLCVNCCRVISTIYWRDIITRKYCLGRYDL